MISPSDAIDKAVSKAHKPVSTDTGFDLSKWKTSSSSSGTSTTTTTSSSDSGGGNGGVASVAQSATEAVQDAAQRAQSGAGGTQPTNSADEYDSSPGLIAGIGATTLALGLGAVAVVWTFVGGES